MSCGSLRGWLSHKAANTRCCKWCEPYNPNLPNPKKQAPVYTRPGPKPGTVPLAPCGTISAHRRHKNHGEPVDAACKAANDRENAKKRTQRWEVKQGAPCGTYAAAARHQRHGEPLDEACLQARREYDRANKQAKRGPRKPLAPCGTHGALRRHRLAGERCQTCIDADNARVRERRARKNAERNKP